MPDAANDAGASTHATPLELLADSETALAPVIEAVVEKGLASGHAPENAVGKIASSAINNCK